jgi:hypothetical protein
MAASSVSYGRTRISQERPSYDTSTEWSYFPSDDGFAIRLCSGDASFFINGTKASADTSNTIISKQIAGIESRKDLSKRPTGTIAFVKCLRMLSCCSVDVFA